MTISTKVTGTFDRDAGAGRCIKRLSKLNIQPQDISVAGANSSLMQLLTSQLLKTREQGKYIILLSISGAVIGAAIATFALVVCPQGGFLKDLGVLSSLALGAVMGSMCGTVIGAIVGSSLSEFTGSVSNKRLPGGKIIISVDVETAARKQSVTEIMKNSGATIAATGESDFMKDDAIACSRP